MSERLNTRVAGHSLVSEGAPFDRVGDEYGRIVARRLNYGGVAGEGRALCSCKAMSDPLPSGGARKAWHVAHKLLVLADSTPT